MPVPEAAVNEDHGSVSGEDDVRSAREAGHVRPIPEPSRVKGFSYGDLGGGVLAADASHHAAAGGLVDGVNHSWGNR